MNQADFDLLERQAQQEQRIQALQAELERVVIDNHLLRQEVERLTLKLKPGQETLR
jgi:cell division protein FtsB